MLQFEENEVACRYQMHRNKSAERLDGMNKKCDAF